MKTTLALALCAFSFPALASVKIQEELFVVGQGPEVVRDLVTAGSVEIDHVSSHGFEIYGPKGIKKYLDDKGLVTLNLKSINKSVFADYPSYGQMKSRLMAAAAKRPDIMTVFSIGKSVMGKDLLVVKISDNVNADESEPEFKYISSMHGDEIVGRELTVGLIEEIAQKYGQDQELTDLVNNTEIFIMPSMNPDGSEKRQRANANNVDLNRNFPDITEDSQSSPVGREIENQAVMAFQKGRKFSLSANFHGGSVVVNYPWDSKYDLHPLNDFIRELSLGYAELNPEMRNSNEFQGGVTNGAQWYVVKGGMQDWSYFWHNDLQVTIELSYTKWPSYSEIPKFYQENRDSMVYFMKQVHKGAGFRMSRPGVEGVVSIRQNSPEMKDIGSYTFFNSEFYKVMPEGNYTLKIQEKSGATQTVEVSVNGSSVKANGNYVDLR